jgi:hypothetical protein
MMEDEPLPDVFGGLSSDLDAIFLHKWLDRQTLVKKDKALGQKGIFNLLVPTYHPYAVNDRLVIEKGLGPLTIKGWRSMSDTLQS